MQKINIKWNIVGILLFQFIFAFSKSQGYWDQIVKFELNNNNTTSCITCNTNSYEIRILRFNPPTSPSTITPYKISIEGKVEGVAPKDYKLAKPLTALCSNLIGQNSNAENVNSITTLSFSESADGKGQDFLLETTEYNLSYNITTSGDTYLAFKVEAPPGIDYKVAIKKVTMFSYYNDAGEVLTSSGNIINNASVGLGQEPSNVCSDDLSVYFDIPTRENNKITIPVKTYAPAATYSDIDLQFHISDVQGKISSVEFKKAAESQLYIDYKGQNDIFVKYFGTQYVPKEASNGSAKTIGNIIITNPPYPEQNTKFKLEIVKNRWKKFGNNICCKSITPADNFDIRPDRKIACVSESNYVSVGNPSIVEDPNTHIKTLQCPVKFNISAPEHVDISRFCGKIKLNFPCGYTLNMTKTLASASTWCGQYNQGYCGNGITDCITYSNGDELSFCLCSGNNSQSVAMFNNSVFFTIVFDYPQNITNPCISKTTFLQSNIAANNNAECVPRSDNLENTSCSSSRRLEVEVKNCCNGAGVNGVNICMKKGTMANCDNFCGSTCDNLSSTNNKGVAVACLPDTRDNESIIVKACKNNEESCRCGISTADLVAINKHILLIQNLTGYNLLAADVNGDGKVSTADMIELRKMILFITTTFPTDCWKIYPKGQSGANPSCILSESAEGHISFEAVKTGDVNCTCDATMVPAPLSVNYTSKSYNTGDAVRLKVLSTRSMSVAAYQMGLNFAPSYLQFDQTATQLATSDQYGTGDINNGNLRLLWIDDNGYNKSLNTGDIITEIRFIALQPISDLSQYVHFDDNILPGRIVLSDDTEFSLQWSSVNGLQDASERSNKTTQLDWLTTTIVPNPSSDDATLVLGSQKETPLLIEVKDVSGRVVFRQNVAISEGVNKVALSSKSWTAGVYFISVFDQNELKETLKFIKK